MRSNKEAITVRAAAGSVVWSSCTCCVGVYVLDQVLVISQFDHRFPVADLQYEHSIVCSMSSFPDAL